jgi:cytoskeletal protein CcmA (bactofilin family)
MLYFQTMIHIALGRKSPMFSKKTSHAQLDMPNTVIGQGVLLEAARMTGRESIRIDGDFKGEIDIEASLVLGDTSVVTGDIRAQYIVVAGQVNGNIHCDTIVHFASTAQVYGDVVTRSLIMDEGSQVNGRYSVGEITPEVEPFPPYAPEYESEKYLSDD